MPPQASISRLAHDPNKLFLEALFGEAWPEVHVCAIPGDPKDRTLPRWYWSGGYAKDMLPYCFGNTNNYFCVSRMSHPDRLQIHFKSFHVLGLDDVGPAIRPDDARALLGEPDYILETSPNNQQWGYRMEPPLLNGDEAEDLQRKVRMSLTGRDAEDPGMQGCHRYLRLPMGVNLKASLGRPWQVRTLRAPRASP